MFGRPKLPPEFAEDEGPATLAAEGEALTKNLWKRGKGGRTYIDDETAALIDALTAQAQAQWKHEPGREP